MWWYLIMVFVYLIINNLGIQNNRMTPVMSIKNRSATTTSKGGAILVGSTTGKLNK